MKEGVLAILDEDEAYVQRLGNYLNESDFMAMRVFIFSSPEKFEDFLEKEKTDVILVQQSLWKEEYTGKNGMMLCENRLEAPEQEPWIYKYQSARAIGQEIMGLFAKNFSGTVGYGKKKNVFLWSVFPVGDENMGSAFAWELAKTVGDIRKTLFISLKAFSGMGAVLGQSWSEDLSDCIYFLRKEEGNTAVKIQAVIRQENNFFYIPAAWSEEDINNISKEEWRRFLQIISENLDFEQIILDLAEGARDFRFWLEESDYIFSPLADELSVTRAKERSDWMEKRGEGEAVKRWITFPAEGLKRVQVYGGDTAGLAKDYVNQILKGKGVWNGKI